MVAGKARKDALRERNAVGGILGVVNVRSPSVAPVFVSSQRNGTEKSAYPIQDCSGRRQTDYLWAIAVMQERSLAAVRLRRGGTWKSTWADDARRDVSVDILT